MDDFPFFSSTEFRFSNAGSLRLMNSMTPSDRKVGLRMRASTRCACAYWVPHATSMTAGSLERGAGASSARLHLPVRWLIRRSTLTRTLLTGIAFCITSTQGSNGNLIERAWSKAKRHFVWRIDCFQLMPEVGLCLSGLFLMRLRQPKQVLKSAYLERRNRTVACIACS